MEERRRRPQLILVCRSRGSFDAVRDLPSPPFAGSPRPFAAYVSPPFAGSQRLFRGSLKPAGVSTGSAQLIFVAAGPAQPVFVSTGSVQFHASRAPHGTPGRVSGLRGDGLEPSPRACSSPAPSGAYSSPAPSGACSSPAPSGACSSPAPSGACSSPAPSGA